MTRETYHVGGYLPGAPKNNLAELVDLDAGTIKRYALDGTPIEDRLLTPDEIAALAPVPVVITPDEKIAAAVTALAALDTISAPVLPVDVLDILAGVRTALEG